MVALFVSTAGACGDTAGKYGGRYAATVAVSSLYFIVLLLEEDAAVSEIN